MSISDTKWKLSGNQSDIKLIFRSRYNGVRFMDETVILQIEYNCCLRFVRCVVNWNLM